MKAGLICGEMARADNEVFQLFGNIAGEMRVEDIPLASGVDVNELKKGDDDPLEVVVEIPASKSKRGWNYTGESLRNIVDAVMSRTLNGFLGHQKPEDINNQFLPPVTHWVGAKMEGETAYFRGIVDAAAKDLKRWIRSGRIKQVSIFGMPKIRRSNGETYVVGYKPLSIDWTPLDRAGMNTRIVAMSGEMWDLEGHGPKGEMKHEGGKDMTPKELLTKLKEMVDNRQVTIPMIAGEMGWKAQDVAGEVDSKWLKDVTGAVETLDEVKKALGVAGEMDVVEVAKKAAKALEEQSSADREKVIGEMLDQKITSDAVKQDIRNPETVIGKMWDLHKSKIKPDMSREAIAGEIDNFLNDTVVKNLVSQYHTDQPVVVGSSSQNGQPKHLRVKRSSI